MSTEPRHDRDVPTGASGSAYPPHDTYSADPGHGMPWGANGNAPLWPPEPPTGNHRGLAGGLGTPAAPTTPGTGDGGGFAGPLWPTTTEAANGHNGHAAHGGPAFPHASAQAHPVVHPAVHVAGHPASPQAEAAVAVGTLPRGGEAGVSPTGVAGQARGGQTLDTPEDIELQKHITTRMAMLQRDPRYQRMQRTLASRRSLRSRLYEFTFILDIALSIFALFFAQSYRTILGQLFGVDLYVHVFGVSDTALLAVLVVFIWPVVFSRLKLYSTSWLADRYSYVRVVTAVGLCTLLTSGMLYFLASLDRTRIFLVFFAVLDALLLVAARVILRPLVTTRLLRRRVLIVGTGRLALEATQSIARRNRLGLELVGVVGPERDVLSETDAGDNEEERASAKYQAWQSWRIGEIRDVVDIVRDRAVDLVLLALSPQERFETTWVISSVAHLPVQVYVVPDVVWETAKTATDGLDGMPMVGLAESGITGWSARAKRLIDLAICLPILLVIWPLMLLIAVAVRLDSPGPALFKQERVGQHNARFKMLKFRTMYVDADRRAREVAVQTAQGLVHKRKDDPRVTRLGRLLRRTSLDELPQLFNVIKGDMSIVGPRPELPWIVERYRAWQYRRLLVPQGITGWWQVHGRSDRVLHLHTQDDIYYVRNYSFWLDIKILLMTIKVVLTGRGAY